MNPFLEPPFLFLITYREPIFYKYDPRADDHPLIFGTRPEKFLVFLRCTEPHNLHHPCPVIPAAVKKDHLSGGRQVFGIPLKIPLCFSFSVGIPKATTLQKRGFRYSITRLMTPPLPAASRPSNKTTTLSFLNLIHSSNFTSSN